LLEASCENPPMGTDIDDFVHQQNLDLYQKLLAELPADDSRRPMLKQLVAEANAWKKHGRS
jgi:hypothetical protein